MARIIGTERTVASTRLAEALDNCARPVNISGNDGLFISMPSEPSSRRFEEGLSLPVCLGPGNPGDGGGLRSLLAHIVRTSSLEGQMKDDGYIVALPEGAETWIRSHCFTTRLLAAAFDVDRPEVSVTDSFPETRRTAYLLQFEDSDRSPLLRMLVDESNARDGGSEVPSPTLGRAIARQRDLLSLLVGTEVQLRSRTIDPSRLNWGRRLPTYTTRNHVVVVHPPSLDQFARRVSKRDVAFSKSVEQRIDLMILDAVLRRDGLSEVMLIAPADGAEGRARFAIRTCVNLFRAGGVVSRSLADETYRSAVAYNRFLSITFGFGARDLDALRRVFGRNRWSQIERHAAYRRESTGRFPWTRFAAACESLCFELTDRSRRPGYAPPSPVVEIVNRLYRAPRGAILKQVWQQQIEKGELCRALEQARLSILRGYLRAIPRVILLRAACGDVSFVRERLSSAFGRRGRRLFDEDLLALQSRIDRKEFEDWESLLSARATVYSAARRA